MFWFQFNHEESLCEASYYPTKEAQKSDSRKVHYRLIINMNSICTALKFDARWR